MKKKYPIAAIAIGFVLIVIFILALTRTGNTSDKAANPQVADDLLTPHNFKEANEAPITGPCHEENGTIDISSEERTDIEYASLSHLIDVPAGTNVDIELSTYTEKEVTGSDRYPEAFGSYNFKMIKRHENWVITQFLRCS